MEKEMGKTERDEPKCGMSSERRKGGADMYKNKQCGLKKEKKKGASNFLIQFFSLEDVA